MLAPVDRQGESSFVDRIDPDLLDQHLEAMVGLDRVSGSDDERVAAEYVKETLESYGVDVDLHDFEAFISIPESGEVTVTSPTQRTFEEAITVSFGESTGTAGLHGEVVVVDEPADPGPEVAGKIAFTSGIPTPSMVGSLEAASAAGLVVASPDDYLHNMIVTPIWGGAPTPEDVDAIPTLPIVEIPAPAGHWIRNRLEKGPVDATIHTRVTTGLTELPCPVGRIPGQSERFLLMGCHIDSWAEGITDNASGMAALLEIARIYADVDLRRGLVLGFWPAHSTGRYAGSTWFADEHWLDLRENGVGYVHVDGLGQRGADMYMAQRMAELEDEHDDVIERYIELPVNPGGDEGGVFETSSRPSRNADMSFWGSGLSSVFSATRLTPEAPERGPTSSGWWWHTIEDTRDKVETDALAREVGVFVAIASRICHSPVMPHDFRDTARDLGRVLEEVETEAGMRFDEIHDRLDDFERVLEKAYALIDGYDNGTELEEAIEDIQVELGNVLIPAIYMRLPEYEHDPALPQQQLPSLRVSETLGDRSGRDRLFAEISLQRRRTKLAHRLGRATNQTRRFVKRHTD